MLGVFPVLLLHPVLGLVRRMLGVFMCLATRVRVAVHSVRMVIGGRMRVADDAVAFCDLRVGGGRVGGANVEQDGEADEAQTRGSGHDHRGNLTVLGLLP